MLALHNSEGQLAVTVPTLVSPIPILTYHQIDAAPSKAPAPIGGTYRSLYVAPEAFAAQMAWLAALGYQGLSMAALMPYLRGEKTGRVVGITFDDGYLNNLVHAMPALQRHGFSATCYVVSQRMGRTNDWDIDQGVAQTALMDARHLREWVAGGQEVGAHSRNHVHLNRVPEHTARAEIAMCKTELEQSIGSPVQHFCYPYGDHAPEHVAMVHEAGYVTATTTQRGKVRAGDGLLQLPRVPVVRSTTRAALWMKVATGYEDRRRG